MPLRRCVIRRRLDKSDCIGIETCYVFHCAAVSSTDIFKTAVSISCTKKDWRESFDAIIQWSAIATAVPKISNDDTAAQWNTQHVSMPIRSDLSRQQIMTQWRIGATGTQSVHYDTIYPTGNQLYVLTATFGTSVQWSNRHVFMQYDLICPNSIAIRFVQLLKTVFHAICFVQRAAKLVRKVDWFVSFCNDCNDTFDTTYFSSVFAAQHATTSQAASGLRLGYHRLCGS